MLHIQSAQLRSWRAELALEFERRAARTVLSARRHDGPLVIQKPLYPEGDEVCHAIIVHPPGGIAGGDELELSARLKPSARVLLTTPGAGKWYRSAGPWARQQLTFVIESGAALEWLPQETIVFDHALAELRTDVQLGGDANFIGWEILCLGRTGSNESFDHGECRMGTSVERDGKVLFIERGQLAGGSRPLASMTVMSGQPVAATMLAVSPGVDADLLAKCRAAEPVSGAGAVTLLPGVLIGRYLGASSEAAKNYFIQLWRVVRPAVMGRVAIEPRIWRT